MPSINATPPQGKQLQACSGSEQGYIQGGGEQDMVLDKVFGQWEDTHHQPACQRSKQDALESALALISAMRRALCVLHQRKRLSMVNRSVRRVRTALKTHRGAAESTWVVVRPMRQGLGVLDQCRRTREVNGNAWRVRSHANDTSRSAHWVPQRVCGSTTESTQGRRRHWSAPYGEACE
jgi:hypothetical protein